VRTEKPGAVHIELPEGLAKVETNERPLEPRRFRRLVPDDKIVDRAFDLLKKQRSRSLSRAMAVFVAAPATN